MYLTANTSLETHIPPPAASSIAFHEIQDKGMTNGLQNAAGLQQVNMKIHFSVVILRRIRSVRQSAIFLRRRTRI